MNQPFSSFLKSSTARLAGTYLAIIMVMSIGFSLVFYNVSSHAVNRRPSGFTSQNGTMQIYSQGVPSVRTSIDDFFDAQANQARDELIARLLLVNILALIAGAGISYLLARRTLMPIEANMEAQRQFVSDASHELRTPLTAIQTTNEVTLRNKKLTLAQAKEVIADNTNEVAKLKALSDGLLNLAKNDRTRQPLTDVSVQSAVQAAMNQIVSAAQAKDIAVEDSAAKIMVRSNEHILSQILVIFLDNAIKYSKSDSTIYITTSTKGNQAFVQVRDEGVGIRAGDVPLIFKRFYRADNARTGSYEHGYGLGLAIAQKLADAHSMNVSVSSEINKGSTFTIRLQLVK